MREVNRSSTFTGGTERIQTLRPNKIGKSVDGRVSSKTTLRLRSRDNPNLTVFNFVIQDETAEINVVAWDEVATRLYDQLKVNNCYRVTMFKVKEITIANQAYKVTDHPCELTLTKVAEFFPFLFHQYYLRGF